MNSSELMMMFPGFNDPSCSNYSPSKVGDPSCSRYVPSRLGRDPNCSNYPSPKARDPRCSKYRPRNVKGGVELVKASTEVGAEGDKSTATKKAAAALKNHSEAEKRRRERINAHLATLRTLVPGSSKMEKASLLAEVITQMKQLKRNATDAIQGSVMPLGSDEVVVDHIQNEESSSSSFYIQASVCCEFKHEILFDLKKSIDTLGYLKLVRVEIGTVLGRMKTTFVLRCNGKSAQGSQLSYKYVSGSVRQALKSVIDSFSAAQELSIDFLSTKRRRRSSSP